jgi:hypothetical protein
MAFRYQKEEQKKNINHGENFHNLMKIDKKDIHGFPNFQQHTSSLGTNLTMYHLPIIQIITI